MGVPTKASFLTRDADEGAEAMRALLGAAPRIHRVAEDYEMSIEVVIGDRVSTGRMKLPSDVPSEGITEDRHIVVLPRRGSHEVRRERTGLTVNDRAALLFEAGVSHQVLTREAEFDLITVDAALVSALTRGAARRPQPTALGPGMTRHMASTARWFADTVLADPDAYASDILRQAGETAVATAVAVAFGFVGENSRVDPALSPASVRRALAYLEEHVADPISLADIAQGAGLTVRGLQAAFQRHLDTSPMAELRRLRMLRVHDALRDADPYSSTVAPIARRWGFAHLSRFASDYRSQFGELPSQTLRR